MHAKKETAYQTDQTHVRSHFGAVQTVQTVAPSAASSMALSTRAREWQGPPRQGARSTRRTDMTLRDMQSINALNLEPGRQSPWLPLLAGPRSLAVARPPAIEVVRVLTAIEWEQGSNQAEFDSDSSRADIDFEDHVQPSFMETRTGQPGRNSHAVWAAFFEGRLQCADCLAAMIAACRLCR